jgi:acetyl-CoA synthetase
LGASGGVLLSLFQHDRAATGHHDNGIDQRHPSWRVRLTDPLRTTSPDGDGTIYPTAAGIAASNVGRWIRELGLKDYDALHRFSIGEMDTFLRMAIDKIGIAFREPFEQLLDLTAGVERPVWFRGARMNIADSVFRATKGSTAISVVSAKEGSREVKLLSAAELERLSSRVANGLIAMGFGRGAPIAIAMPMTPECVAIYLGIVRAGMVAVSIADSFAPDEIATRLRIAGARAVFTQDVLRRDGKTIPLHGKVAAADAPGALVVRTRDGQAKLRDGDIPFDRFLSSESDFDNVACDPGDPVNILFSSGTTGDPKAIPWNHTTPIRCALDGFVHQDIRPGDVVAWPTNVGWMMGPWLIFATLINRATIALYDGSPSGRRFGEFVEQAGVTMMGVVPSLVRAWRSSGCMQDLDWSRIRAFSSTGEASNAEDMRWLMSTAGGKPVVEYCGGTETGGSYVTSTVVEPNRPAHFSSKTIASDFVILDEDGAESEAGEVFLAPPVLGHSTHLLNADHHSVYFAGCPAGKGGRVLRRHGDEIQTIAGGYYRALGRADDTMNLGGIKVGSVELERTMNRLRSVVETAAIAVQPADGGPSSLVVYAVVNGAPDPSVLQSELQQRLREDLNPLFKIADIRIVDALPRTASNKVMRRVLRNHYRSES